MRIFILLLLTVSLASADSGFSLKFVHFFKSLNFLNRISIKQQLKDFEIKKIYVGNSFQFKSAEELSAQTVMIEAWNAKTQSGMLLISPQGLSDFFEIKNLVFLSNSDDSSSQRILGEIFLVDNEQIKKSKVKISKNLDAVTLEFEGQAFTNSLNLSRLDPKLEKEIADTLYKVVSLDSAAGMKIKVGFRVNGENYFADSVVGYLKLLKIHPKTGELVDSQFSCYIDKKGEFTVFQNRTEIPQQAERLSLEEISKALNFKTFDFKSIIETKTAERVFSPNYYIKTAEGRDLFLSKFDLNQKSESLNPYGSFNGKIVTYSHELGQIKKEILNVSVEYKISSIYLSIYSVDNKVLKIDISESNNPKIVENEWQVKMIGRTFDNNFFRVTSSFNKISNLVSSGARSCEKLF